MIIMGIIQILRGPILLAIIYESAQKITISVRKGEVSICFGYSDAKVRLPKSVSFTG